MGDSWFFLQKPLDRLGSRGVRGQEDPAELITKLSESLATEMPLRARLTTPTLQQKQVGERVVWVSERLKRSWGQAS